MARIPGTAVSVFDIATNHYIGFLESATLSYNKTRKEGKGIHEFANAPIEVGSEWKIEAECMVEVSAVFVPLAIAGGNYAVTVNTGANTYTGQVQIDVSHEFKREDLQMQKVTLFGYGDLTVTAPS